MTTVPMRGTVTLVKDEPVLEEVVVPDVATDEGALRKTRCVRELEIGDILGMG